MDQSVHTPLAGLQQRPSQDIEFPERLEPGTARRRSRLAWAFGTVAPILSSTSALQSTAPDHRAPGPATPQAAPMPVTAAEASIADVPIYLDGLGTVQASNS